MSNGNPFAPRFETKQCARCKGTGRVTINDTASFKCHPCSGSGQQLTRRGKAARDYMRDRLIRPAAEIKLGDMVWFPVGSVKASAPVLQIETTDAGRIRLHGVRRKTSEPITYSLAPAGKVEMAYTCTELEVIRDEVEQYQASLAKAGAVTKRPHQARQAA
ncbi:hypothetical protein [Pseudomonas lurida]|uniref:hypothetical protein n=1 Tax=Pseudomonas lurida TaxID=244566 RepID=UPI00177BC424|nr:hypothetical protein [Pseudomonas lurida]MBD8671634.1 hypothetical protein [Pseudomonas lurida]